MSGNWAQVYRMEPRAGRSRAGPRPAPPPRPAQVQVLVAHAARTPR